MTRAAVGAERYDAVFAELDESVRAIYQGPSGYFRDHEQRFRHDLQITERISTGGPILEIGSFPCYLTYCLHRLGYAVTGVDLDPERAAEFIAHHRLTVIRCDVEQERLPFADATFDVVLFNEIFEHLRVNPLLALREINRVLRPDGSLVLTTPNLYSLKNIVSFCLGRGVGVTSPYKAFKQLETVGHMGHIREYSTREIQEFLENTGFRAREIQYLAYEKSRRGVLVDFAYRCIPPWRPFQIVIGGKGGRASPGPRD